MPYLVCKKGQYEQSAIGCGILALICDLVLSVRIVLFCLMRLKIPSDFSFGCLANEQFSTVRAALRLCIRFECVQAILTGEEHSVWPPSHCSELGDVFYIAGVVPHKGAVLSLLHRGINEYTSSPGRMTDLKLLFHCSASVRARYLSRSFAIVPF